MSFNFVAAVTVHGDLESKKMQSLFPLFPHLFATSDGTGCYDLS